MRKKLVLSGVMLLLLGVLGSIVSASDETKSPREPQSVVTEDHPHLNRLRVASGSGMQVEPLTFQLRKFFNIEDDSGVLIRYVRERSAASTAGLRAGDVITEIANRKIRSPSEFLQALRAARGSRVPVKIIRAKGMKLVNLVVPGQP